jgi:hypothetical protein
MLKKKRSCLAIKMRLGLDDAIDGAVYECRGEIFCTGVTGTQGLGLKQN